MVHMIQVVDNGSMAEECTSSKGNAQIIAMLNKNIRNSIADESTCFVEKSQDAVRLAKEILQELEESEEKASKSELGQRNLICTKFLAGMYREVIVIDTSDGMSLMVIANAYYALGKAKPALSVLQRAGIELKKKIASSSEYTILCSKLFNNMACCYFELGKYDKAMQTFQRALELFHDGNSYDQTAWISAIVDQASIMNNMAYTLIKHKQFDDASDLVDASFELQQVLPETADKSLTISTLSTMAYIYYRTKKYRLSLDTYSACIQLQVDNTMYTESDHVEVLKKMAGKLCLHVCHDNLSIHTSN